MSVWHDQSARNRSRYLRRRRNSIMVALCVAVVVTVILIWPKIHARLGGSHFMPGSLGFGKSQSGADTYQPEARIFPFELVQNIYAYKGKIVLFRNTSVPHVSQGHFMGASDPRPQIGFTSLAFERGFDETSALYEAVALGNDPEHVGEILAHVPSEFPERLDVVRDWVVRVDGVKHGRNALGGPIEIPEITFLRYDPSRNDDARSSLGQVRQGSTAIDGDPRIVNCCAAAAQIMQDPFEFKGKWDLSMQLFPQTINGVLNVTRFPGSPITALSYDHSISQDETVYQANWGNGSTYGYIIVEVAASRAQTLDLKRDWLIETLGMEDLTNAMGAKVALAKIRFLGYSEQ